MVKMILLYPLLLLLLNIPSCYSYRDEFISSYLQIEKAPRVVIFSCWNQRIISNLLKLSNKFQLNLKQNIWKIDGNLFRQETLIITDSKCLEFPKLLQDANRLDLFRTRVKWLIFNFDNQTLLTGNLKILIDSRFTTATPVRNNQIELNFIYKIRKNSLKFAKNFIGIYSIEKKRFLEFNNFTFAKNRTDLQRSVWNTSFVLTHNDSMQHLDDYRQKHIDAITKISLKILQPTLDQLNVTKKFIPQQSWGKFNKTTQTTQNGMLGDLYDGISDTCGTGSLTTFERIKFFSCMQMYAPNQLKFILRDPPLSYVENIATLPFQTNVWYACYIITIIILCVMYVIVLWEVKTKHYFEEVSDSRNLLNYEELNVEFSDICLLQLGCVSQQGTEIEPKSYSGRIATFTILLALMFLYTSYSANIVALLQSTSDSITTVSDLLESGISLGAEDVVYNHYLLSRDQDPLRKQLYLKKLVPEGQHPNFYKIEDGIRKLQTEFFAFHSDVSPCYEIIQQTFQEHEKCSLREISFLQSQSEVCLLVRTDSPYRRLLDFAAIKVTETGVRQREVERLYNKKPDCSGQAGSFKSVGLLDAYFAFVLFAFGVSLSLILLIIEKIFGTKTKKKRFLN